MTFRAFLVFLVAPGMVAFHFWLLLISLYFESEAAATSAIISLNIWHAAMWIVAVTKPPRKEDQ